MEIVPEKSKNFMNYLFLISEACTPMLLGSTYFYLHGKEWKHLFLLSLILAPLGTILLFFIPKSPRYLLSINKEEEAKAELKAIAKFNSKTLPYNFDLVSQNSDSTENLSHQLSK
jgi:MFS family permease